MMSKEEKAEYLKVYREANKERLAAYKKAYYEANKEKCSERMRIYRESHKEQAAEYNKSYRESHKEELAEYKKTYNKSYRETHKEQISERQNAYNKVYREENKEQIAEHNKAYRETNKVIIAERQKSYRNTKNGRARTLLANYKRKDKKLNRGECTLTVEWIVENIFSGQVCHWCGESDWMKLGCDRIDNNLPHTPENVVCSCWDCNNARKGMTYDEYRRLINTKIA